MNEDNEPNEDLTTPLVGNAWNGVNNDGQISLHDNESKLLSQPMFQPINADQKENSVASPSQLPTLRNRCNHYMNKSIQSYASFVLNRKYFVLAFWFLAIPLGIIYGNQFIEEVGTTNVYSIAPDDTPSKNATDAILELYNETVSEHHSVVVLIEDLSNSGGTMFEKNSLKYKTARDFVVDLEVWLRYSYLNTTEGIEQFDDLIIRSYYHFEECCRTYALDEYAHSTTFYYEEDDTDERLKAQYMAMDFECVDRDWFEDLSMKVEEFCDEINDELDDSDIRVSAISQALIRDETQDIYQDEVVFLLLLCVPSSALLYLFVVKSFLVTFAAYLTAIISTLSSMAIMLPVSRAIENEEQEMSCVTPILMLCLHIALSRSYSMTIWSKFLDVKSLDVTNPTTATSPSSNPVYEVLVTAGRAVLSSATILFCSIACLMFIPNARILNDFGYGASVTIWITAICHLNLFPALLVMVHKNKSDSTQGYRVAAVCNVCTPIYSYVRSCLASSRDRCVSCVGNCLSSLRDRFVFLNVLLLLVQVIDCSTRALTMDSDEAFEFYHTAGNVTMTVFIFFYYLAFRYKKRLDFTVAMIIMGFAGYLAFMILSVTDTDYDTSALWSIMLALTTLISLATLVYVRKHRSDLEYIDDSYREERVHLLVEDTARSPSETTHQIYPEDDIPIIEATNLEMEDLQSAKGENEIKQVKEKSGENDEKPEEAQEVQEKPEKAIYEKFEEEEFHENAEIVTREQHEYLSKSRWYSFGKAVTHAKLSLLLLWAIICCSIPVAIHSSLDSKEYNISPEGWLPDHSDFMAELDSIREYFGDNKLNRYKIIFDASNVEDGIITDSSFNTMQTVLDVFTQAYATSSLRSFTGIASLQGEPVSFVEYTEAISCVQDEYCQPNERQRTIVLLSKSLNNADSTATIAFAELIVDPYSSEGIDWLKSVRQAVDDLYGENMLNGVSVSILGEAAVQYDVADDLYDTFPFVFCIVFLVLFLLIGVMYDSFVHPVRSFLSTLLTLFFSYGLSCVVYDDDLNYVAPVMAFYVALGISLDTDTLLAVKIMDYRDEEFDYRSSVIVGLWSTGTSILTGGMIMVITFGSLLLTDEPALQQIGFFLLCSSVFDFFVIRLVVIPGLIAHPFFASWAWWPRTFRPMQKDISNL